MAKQISIDLKKRVVELTSSGKSIREVANLLKLPKSTVHRISKKGSNNEDLARKPGSGRRRKTTLTTDRLIHRKSVNNPFLTAEDISIDLNENYGIQIGRMTVSRRLASFGLNGRVAVKKPLISAKNRAKRIAFARKHLNWTVEDWSNVLFSGESKFFIFGSDGKRYVRRPVNERNESRYLKPTVKHGGGKVLVWGCFSMKGVGPLKIIEGTMTGETYRALLNKSMVPYSRQNMPECWIFQHDNDPKHTSGVVKNFLAKEKIRVLEWPAQSPDLNPIEHLWNELGKAVGPLKHSCRQDLIDHLNKKWQEISSATIKCLIESMPRRCEAVIKANGYPTKY